MFYNEYQYYNLSSKEEMPYTKFLCVMSGQEQKLLFEECPKVCVNLQTDVR